MGETPEIDASPLVASLGFLLRAAQQKLYEEFYDRVGREDLTPAGYSLLALLRANPNARQVALADALRVKQSNLAVLINRLEGRGLIARRTDPDDRRNNRIVLEPAGEAALGRMKPDLMAMEANFRGRLGPEREEAVRDGLKRLLDL